MLDWLRWAFISPYSSPYGLIAYLSVPIITSIVLAVILRRRDDVTWIALFVSLFTYFAIYAALFGVRSTISIGIAFAAVPFGVVCAAAVTAVRLLQRALSRR